MIRYPLKFDGEAIWKGAESTWTGTSEGYQVVCAVPPEFQGPGGALSPESMFLQTALSCLMGTFQVYCQGSKVQNGEVRLSGTLVVEPVQDGDLGFSSELLGKPVMKRLLVRAQVSGSSHPDRAKMLLQKAWKSGFILNSLRTELSLECEILP
jgi:organic hydroperoxide reductase OsmC/OhrA